MLIYLIRYKFSILLAGFIALVSLLPSSSLPDSTLFSIVFLDKLVHFGMYGLLGLVVLLETRCTNRCHGRHLLLLILVFFLSALIEVLQATLIASRAAEWLDLAANGLGLYAGYLSYLLILYIRS
jgi:VanZ family protein